MERTIGIAIGLGSVIVIGIGVATVPEFRKIIIDPFQKIGTIFGLNKKDQPEEVVKVREEYKKLL